MTQTIPPSVTADAARYPHLGPKALAVITSSDAQRIANTELKRFFHYPAVTNLLERFERLLNLPRTSRPEGLLMVQKTNSGKTSVIEQFLRRHEPDPNPDGEAVVRPVLRIAMPSNTTEAKLYEAMLTGLGLPPIVSGRMSARLGWVTRLLSDTQVKILLFDETQHMHAAGKRALHLLETIKHWSTEAQVNVIVVGLPETHSVVASSDELINRLEPTVLPLLEEERDFLTLLIAYERALPLQRPSSLVSPDLATSLLVNCEGLVGELDRLLKKAAVAAIQDGSEQITADLIAQLVKSGQWRLPSRRREIPRGL